MKIKFRYATVSALLLLMVVQPLLIGQSRFLAAAASSFSFTATGDYGDDSPGNSAHDVAAKINEVNPNFHIALGDLRYGSLDAAAWCNNFKSVYGRVIIITGNHDSGEDDLGPTSTYADACPFSVLGVNMIDGTILGSKDSGGTTSYGYEYAFDYPAAAPVARFIMVSPGIIWGCCGLSGSHDYITDDQNYNWVSARIDEAKAIGLWVIMGMHKNCLNEGSTHTSCESSVDLQNLGLTKRVDLWLSAHEHNYERSYQLTSCDTSGLSCQFTTSYIRGAGTVSNIVGTGGAGNYGCGATRQSFAKCMDSDYGFAKYDVSSSEITETYISATGSFTDTFTIGQTGGPGSGCLQCFITTIPPMWLLLTFGVAMGLLLAVIAGRGRRAKHVSVPPHFT